jgi:hypothetical protein
MNEGLIYGTCDPYSRPRFHQHYCSQIRTREFINSQKSEELTGYCHHPFPANFRENQEIKAFCEKFQNKNISHTIAHWDFSPYFPHIFTHFAVYSKHIFYDGFVVLFCYVLAGLSFMHSVVSRPILHVC